MHCRIWCSALVVMAVVVWSWDASYVHCESYCSTYQENKSVHCRIWCSALVVMAVVVWSWDASCVHCESYCSTYTLVILMMGIMMPETC